MGVAAAVRSVKELPHLTFASEGLVRGGGSEKRALTRKYGGDGVKAVRE